MLYLYDRATMAHALTLDLDPQLHRLLSARIATLGPDLIDWTEYLVVEAGDTEADIVRHIGFSPLVEPFDGIRFGEPGFHFGGLDFVLAHAGWFEMVVTFGSTFAYILFVQNDRRVPQNLLVMCRQFCS